MTRNPSIRVVVSIVFAASVLLGVAAVYANGATADQATKSGKLQAAQNVFPQPDTSSPDWKSISDDVGIWVGPSDHSGLRGRLYVRKGGAWMPVAVDGAADIFGAFPAAK